MFDATLLVADKLVLLSIYFSNLIPLAIVGGIIGALVLLVLVISLGIAIVVFAFICVVRKQAHR